MSSRVTRLRSQKFQDNISAKRGLVAVAEVEVILKFHTYFSTWIYYHIESTSSNILRSLIYSLTSKKKETGYTVSPYLLGFIFFVLVGSSVFELLKNVGGKK